MIVTAIGNDEQRSFPVFCVFHFAQSLVNGVQQRRSTFGLRKYEFFPEIVRVRGEINRETGLVGKGDHEVLVLGIGNFAQLIDGVVHAVQLVRHASADIQNDAH